MASKTAGSTGRKGGNLTVDAARLLLDLHDVAAFQRRCRLVDGRRQLVVAVVLDRVDESISASGQIPSMPNPFSTPSSIPMQAVPWLPLSAGNGSTPRS
jgi:hypothetical protein